MLVNIRRILLLVILVTTGAYAQNYPIKPVRLVAAYPPGGSIDIVARLVAQKLTEAFAQQFVVENRSGASGNIGSEYVAKAAPDGYTLQLMGSSVLTTNIHLYAKLPFDPQRDFAPIIVVVDQSNLLVLHPSVPAGSVRELIALAKAHPGKLTYGSGGVGASQHMSTALFLTMAGVDLVHVPYKGGAPAMLDLLGGQIDLMIETTPSALPYVQSGKIRALGVTSLQRSSMLPKVPTISEAGVAGFEYRSWMALVAPAGTPKDTTGRLNAAMQKALGGELRKRLEELGLDVAGGTPEEVETRVKTEIAKYGKLIKAANITPQ